jgi:hypothetical protein
MIESLKPVAAIAGHNARAPDTPNNIEATRKYIRDFDRIASHTKTALDLYNEMLAIYPERVNPAVLWYSAQAVNSGCEPKDVRSTKLAIPQFVPQVALSCITSTCLGRLAVVISCSNPEHGWTATAKLYALAYPNWRGAGSVLG